MAKENDDYGGKMVYIVVFVLLSNPGYSVTKTVGNYEIKARSDLEEVGKISKSFYASIERDARTSLNLLSQQGETDSSKDQSNEYDRFFHVMINTYAGLDMNLDNLLPSNFSGSFYLYDASFRVNLSSLSFGSKFTNYGFGWSMPPDTLKEIDIDFHRKDKPNGIKNIGAILDIRYILWKDIKMPSYIIISFQKEYYSYKYRCVFLGIEARGPEIVMEFSNNSYDYLVFYRGLNPTIGFYYLYTVSPSPKSSPPEDFPGVRLDLELSITMNPFYMNDLYLYKRYMVAGGHAFYKLIKTNASVYDVNLSTRYKIYGCGDNPFSVYLVLSMRYFELTYKSGNLGKIKTFKDTTLSVGISFGWSDAFMSLGGER